MIYYQDQNIKIRDIRSDDIINLFSCWVDKEINLYDPRPLPNTSEELINECLSFCNRFDIEIMNENIEDRKYRYFIITNSEDNFIGFVNVFNIDKVKKEVEMGVIITDKRYWKKGIAYTSVNVAIRYIFDYMNINRIYIETSETNIPALRLFDKLGFDKCGEVIEDDNYKFIVMEKMEI